MTKKSDTKRHDVQQNAEHRQSQIINTSFPKKNGDIEEQLVQETMIYHGEQTGNVKKVKTI